MDRNHVAAFVAGLLYWGNRFKTLRRTTIILYGLGGGALLVIAAVAINHAAALGGIVIVLLGLPAVFGLFVLTVAAAESAIGLAILVVYYRNRGSIAVEDINMMKG